MKAGKCNTPIRSPRSYKSRISHERWHLRWHRPVAEPAARLWFRSMVAAALAVMAFSVVPTLRAQTTNEVEQLKRQMQQLQENFERVQREQRQQIDALTRKLDDLTKPQNAEAEKKKLEQELTADLQKNQPAPATPTSPAAPSVPWSPAQPITVARAGSAYMNMSFDALMDFGWSTAGDPSKFLELGDHDPNTRGFSLVNAEIVLDGAV